MRRRSRMSSPVSRRVSIMRCRSRPPRSSRLTRRSPLRRRRCAPSSSLLTHRRVRSPFRAIVRSRSRGRLLPLMAVPMSPATRCVSMRRIVMTWMRRRSRMSSPVSRRVSIMRCRWSRSRSSRQTRRRQPNSLTRRPRSSRRVRRRIFRRRRVSGRSRSSGQRRLLMVARTSRPTPCVSTRPPVSMSMHRRSPTPSPGSPPVSITSSRS